jgi:hypothetical protein
MRNSLTLAIAAFVLSACASGPFSEKRDLDSGGQQPGKIVQCNGYKKFSDCERYAAEACPKGYEVLAKEENLATMNRSMRISCK